MALIDDIRKDREAEGRIVLVDCNCDVPCAHLRDYEAFAAIQKRKKARVPDMEAALLAAEELAEVLAEADRQIVWEGMGLGSDFSNRAESALAAYRKATEGTT